MFAQMPMSGRFDLVLGLLHDASGYLHGKFMYPESSLVGATRYLLVNDHRLAVLVVTPDFEVPDGRARVPSFPTLIRLPDSAIRTPEKKPGHESIVRISGEHRPGRGTWHFRADLAYPSSGVGGPPYDLCVAGEIFTLGNLVCIHALHD
jgi:hypothetical protein